MRSRLLLWLLVALLVVIGDQLTKFYIVLHLIPGEPYQLFSWLNFTLTHNNGAAFGMLQRAGGWQRWIFVAIALLVSIVLIISLVRMPVKRLWQPLALALILGGALGNLYDRIALGYVRDFIAFHIGTWHFAVFNIADSAISIGVLLLIITLLFDRTGSKKRG